MWDARRPGESGRDESVSGQGVLLLLEGLQGEVRHEPAAVREMKRSIWAGTARARALAVLGDYANLTTQVLMNEESIRDGIAHFADNCAQCHANGGAGFEVRETMSSPTPDLKASATQSLVDGGLVLHH